MAGGSLNSKSLPRKLISKRKSLKIDHQNHIIEGEERYEDYPIGKYHKYIESSLYNDRQMLVTNQRVAIVNPELKNLNLKAVESIMLQKLIDQKNSKVGQEYMKSRRMRQRNRLNTAE